jgi:hypothetical protein
MIIHIFLTVVDPKASRFHSVVLENEINVKRSKNQIYLAEFLQLYKNKTTDYETFKTIFNTAICCTALLRM